MVENLEKIKEKSYEIYDNFLKDYLNELNEISKSYRTANFLVKNFDRTRVDDVFLVTIFERIGILIGYNYKVRVHQNNWLNRLKARKYVSKEFITKEWGEEIEPTFISGDLLVAYMMKKWNYKIIRSLMAEILEEYYGIEDF